MAKTFTEKTITVNLRRAFYKPATKRAICAKNMLKESVRKETRIKNIRISNKLNEEFWKNGKYNAPRKITVKIIAEKDGAMVILPTEKYEPKKDIKKQEKKTENTKTTNKNEAETKAKPAETKKETAKPATEKKDAAKQTTEKKIDSKQTETQEN